MGVVNIKGRDESTLGDYIMRREKTEVHPKEQLSLKNESAEEENCIKENKDPSVRKDSKKILLWGQGKKKKCQEERCMATISNIPNTTKNIAHQEREYDSKSLLYQTLLAHYTLHVITFKWHISNLKKQ